jgi:hypothetical protein
MRIDRKSAWIWLGAHVILLIALLLFPLYRRIAEFLTVIFTSCILHDRFHLYCPLCGGTRALDALLSFDITSAFSFNPCVVLLALAFVAWDLRALIRLLRGEKSIYALPLWVWMTVIALTVGYGVLRNVLLVSIGYDPLGDLVGFWHTV